MIPEDESREFKVSNFIFPCWQLWARRTGGVVGVAHFDLVVALLGIRVGGSSPLSSVVYAVVGLWGVYLGLVWKPIQRWWQGQVDMPAHGK